MEYLEYRFTLDMHKSVSQISLPVRQYETNRRLLITFSNKGSPYTITDGCTAVLGATKSDGTTLFDNCTIKDNSTICYEFNDQTASALGIVECSIILYGPEEAVIASPHFIIVVSKNAVAYSEVKSTSESTTIAEMLANESTRQSNEETRQAGYSAMSSKLDTMSEEVEGLSGDVQNLASKINNTDASVLDEKLNTEIKTRETNEAALQSQITNEQSARIGDFDTIRSAAIGVPTYDANTGIMTFKTLDKDITETYDFPIEKIIDNVTLSADGKSFVFTFHNSEPITLPVDNITLPAWITNIASATGDQMLIPPNTEAVRNYIIAILNTEANIRGTADNSIRATAVGTPTLSGQELIFPNLNGIELTRVPLPSGSGDATGGSSDSSVATLPLQSLSYDNKSYEFTKLTDNVYAAKFRFSIADVYCSYGNDFYVARCNNFTEILPEISGRAQLHCQVSTIPLHPYVDSNGIEIEYQTHYPASAMAVECVPEKAMDIDSGYTALTGGLRFKPMDANYCYYIPGHEWYVELELNTEKNMLIIKAFQCDNY